MQLLRAGDYAGAEGGLQLFLELNPDNALAPNAAYWLAETHYVRKDYAAAAAAFARNYRVYGKDDTKAPDNLLKLGMSLQGLQETDKACRTFAELAKEFPNAPAHIQQALWPGNASTPRAPEPNSATLRSERPSSRRLIEALGPFERRPRLAVAVSGGPDSMCLCLLADGWARARGGEVSALIVDHGLRPEVRCGGPAGRRVAERPPVSTITC